MVVRSEHFKLNLTSLQGTSVCLEALANKREVSLQGQLDLLYVVLVIHCYCTHLLAHILCSSCKASAIISGQDSPFS